jgi:deoxyadenosine/deoxycytidine kinase
MTTEPTTTTPTRTVELLQVTIDGTMGSGKSTALAQIAKRPELLGALLGHTDFADACVLVVPEPLANWTNCNGVDLLAEFYADMRRNALRWQLHVIQSRLAHERAVLLGLASVANQPLPARVILVTERSVWTDCGIFAKMLADSGIMAFADALIYDAEFQVTVATNAQLMRKELAEFGVKLHFGQLTQVYIKVAPEVAFARVQQRARKAEVSGSSALTLEYMQKLCAQHDKYFEPVQHHTAVTITLDSDELARRLQLEFPQ